MIFYDGIGGLLHLEEKWFYIHFHTRTFEKSYEIDSKKDIDLCEYFMKKYYKDAALI